MPGDRRRINRCQSRSNRLTSTTSVCRSLIFIADPSCCDAALTLDRLRSTFDGLRSTISRFDWIFVSGGSHLASARQSAGSLRQIFSPVSPSVPRGRAKLRPAPANYLGRLTDSRASLPECRLWSSVDRRPLLDYRRSSFVGGASPKNCRPFIICAATLVIRVSTFNV